MLGIIRLANLTYNVCKPLTVHLHSAHTTINNQKPKQNYEKKTEHGTGKNSYLITEFSLQVPLKKINLTYIIFFFPSFQSSLRSIKSSNTYFYKLL